MIIKPCPICGGRPHIKKEIWNPLYEFYHTCKGIKPPIHIHSYGYKTRADAIAAWNVRFDEINSEALDREEE